MERAAIPVERIEGPVLLFSGEDDQEWPSTQLAGIALERLARHEHPYRHEHVCYRGPDIISAYPHLPTTSRQASHSVEENAYASGTPKADAAASADSWARVLAFFAAGI